MRVLITAFAVATVATAIGASPGEPSSPQGERGSPGAALVAKFFGLVDLAEEQAELAEQTQAAYQAGLAALPPVSSVSTAIYAVDSEATGGRGGEGIQRRLAVLADDDIDDDDPAESLYFTNLDGTLFGQPALEQGGLGTPDAVRGVVYAEDFVAVRGPGAPARIGAMFFDGDGNPLAPVSIEGLPSFLDLGFRTPQLLIDEQGRATIVYSLLPEDPNLPPQVLAQRVDPVSGSLIGDVIVVAEPAYFPSASLLSDDGDAAVVTFISPPNVIRGVVLDLSDPVRGVVGVSFPVSTTASPFTHYAPSVSADRESGRFMVAWENLTGAQFNPVDVLGRRFGPDGTPLDATDFVVNTGTDNAQSQATVAAIDGLDAFAVAWTSDGDSSNDLDLFLQVYDESGAAIFAVDQPLTDRDDIQDRPSLRSMGQFDSENRPLLSLTYRDVANAGGTPRPGETGLSYLGFAIEGLTEGIPPIFVDGFESGDTSAWTASTP
ncbi:MAG: hypothetical protein DWQ36_20020 [Acidobacteria bacterium]|nr:MAG: hypothetical protein DWQ30_08345 [Acidobacteriota bacterium]REK03576.1 MAG: hypothetical protein DWQ36_20020 [Acidobacteriota bacterium]